MSDFEKYLQQPEEEVYGKEDYYDEEEAEEQEQDA
jgi:hypothetical protein